jgi:hypothetical protein
MRLRDYLCIPYILAAEPLELGDGQWTRKLSYPELSGCSAESLDVETALVDLERQRFVEILKRLRAGDPPPIPRRPLDTTDPAWLAGVLGVADLVAGYLDMDAAELAAHHS